MNLMNGSISLVECKCDYFQSTCSIDCTSSDKKSGLARRLHLVHHSWNFTKNNRLILYFLRATMKIAKLFHTIQIHCSQKFYEHKIHAWRWDKTGEIFTET